MQQTIYYIFDKEIRVLLNVKNKKNYRGKRKAILPTFPVAVSTTVEISSRGRAIALR